MRTIFGRSWDDATLSFQHMQYYHVPLLHQWDSASRSNDVWLTYPIAPPLLVTSMNWWESKSALVSQIIILQRLPGVCQKLPISGAKTMFPHLSLFISMTSIGCEPKYPLVVDTTCSRNCMRLCCKKVPNDEWGTLVATSTKIIEALSEHGSSRNWERNFS